MTKSLYGFHGPLAAPVRHPARRLAAATLRQASRLLARLARRLAARHEPPRPTRPPEFEFYAEAGAPEGAVYLDGELIGHVPGVTRL